MQIIPTVTYQVYVRPGGPINGEAAGWKLDRSLRPLTVRLQAGKMPGNAVLKFEPRGAGGISSLTLFEGVLANYTPDHQVRIVMQPIDSQTGLSSNSEGVVIFEGVLMKQSFVAARNAVNDDAEEVTFNAVPMPVLENMLVHHLITGRWIVEQAPVEGGEPDETAAVTRIIESPSVPAAFNADGRPNCDVAAQIAPSGIAGFVGHPFSNRGERDPAAGWWTARRAIRSLLTFWLFGPADSPLPRCTCIAADTLAALSEESSTEARWSGLDTRLPEINVYGLGVFDAIDRVCKAVGMSMSIVPDLTGFPTGDRTYELRLWQQGYGRRNALLMMKPGTFTDDAQTNLEWNDANNVRGQRDALRTRPIVYGRGRTLIEATFPLKPLWSPDDLPEPEELEEDEEPTFDKLLQRKAGVSGYHDRYVAGGESFASFGHVGRMWGLDCTGVFSPFGYPKEPGEGEEPNPSASDAYHHDEKGFDFVGHLKINGAEAEGEEEEPTPPSPLVEERAVLGVTDPIVWTRRVREPLSLRRSDYIRRGQSFILEVSEDGGGTWAPVQINFRLLDGFFGIMLTGGEVANLANVNAAALLNDQVPAVEESWWALIVTKQLQFRLTCAVEADHAARFDAQRTVAAGTLYDRGDVLAFDIEEYWSAPQTINSASTEEWQKLSGWGIVQPTGDGGDVNYITNVRRLAETARAVGEGVPVSCFAETWLMRIGVWQIGDQIESIQGRDFSLSRTVQHGPYVNLVAMDIVLHPDEQQKIIIHMYDTRMTGEAQSA